MPLSHTHFRIIKGIVRVIDGNKRNAFDQVAELYKLPREEWDNEWKRVLCEIKWQKEPVFNVPLPVTAELCYFLGVPVGTWISRNDVFVGICNYLKSRKLLKKQIIVEADRHVQSLLRLGHDEKLMLFHLESRMDHLFCI